MKIRLLIISLTILLVLTGAAARAPRLQAHDNATQLPAESSTKIDQHRLDARLRARIADQLNGRRDELDARLFAPPVTKGSRLPAIMLNHFSTPLRNYLTSDAQVEIGAAAQISAGNLRVNDPAQEAGSRVQNGSSSAVSGENIIIAYNDIGLLNAAISYSNDGGVSWQQTHIPTLSGGSNLGSGVVAARGESFYYAGLAVNSFGLSTIIFSQSNDKGRSWSAPFEVQPLGAGSVFQDKPWLAIDNSDQATAGNIYICWTEFRTGVRAGNRIISAASTDGGRTFPTVVPVSPISAFNVQGATVTVGERGQVYLCWGDLDVLGISFARSLDGGATFTMPQTAASISSYQLIGPLLNSHFNTNGLPSLAVDSSNSANRGALYIVFGASSTVERADKSDIFFVSSKDGGSSWSTPRSINDDRGKSDQFMPSVAVAIDGTIGVMWYDRRNDPIHNGMIDVYAAVSADGGASFTANRRITDANWLLLTTPLNIRNNYHGDYNQMSALTTSAGFLFNWGDDRSGLDADVYSAIIPVDSLKTAKPGFLLSPVTPSQTLIAGQSVLYQLRIVRENGFNGVIEFKAGSDTSGIDATFDNRGINNGELSVRVRTDAGIKIGSHPLVITATSGDQVVSQTLRLNVLPATEFSRLPLKIGASTGRSIEPHGALDRSGAINTIWADDFTGNFRVYFARSKDNVNFSDAQELSQSNFTNFNPQIAVDDANNIHAVWQECIGSNCQTVYTRSKDQGVSFEKPRAISVGVQFSELPSIAVNPNGEVVIFWDGIRSFNVPRFEIFGVRSTTAGEKFSIPVTIAGDNARSFFTTATASDGAGKSYLAYESCANGNCRIETKSSSDGFNTFTNGGTASQDLIFAIKPALSAPGNGEVFITMTVALADGDSRFEIFTATSKDNGASFSKPSNISNTPEASNDSTLVVNGDQVYVAWQDRSSGNPEIFLATSKDHGLTYSSPINISNNNTISQVPTLAKDANGSVQFFFEDEMDGNDEIYTYRLAGSTAAVTISAIEPDNGPAGTNVIIRGGNLSLATAVSINGKPAEFFINSAAELIAVIPAGATSGSFAITTPTGIVTSTIPFTITSAISAGPPSLDFGKIGVGQVLAAQTVQVRNLSNKPLKINSISLTSNDFQLVGAPSLPLQLAANETLPLTVRYAPAQAAVSQGILKISSSDSLLPNINISLSGQATAQVLTLITPVGGEKLRAGEDFTINWRVESGVEVSGFDLLFSNDAGETFTTSIATNLSASTRDFTWNVITLKTKQARVAVVMRTPGGNVFIDSSKSNIKIKVKK